MTIWEITNQALDALDVPFAANVMILQTGSPLPNLFLVYQLITAPPVLHADNVEVMRYYRMQVTTYSRAGLENLPDVAGAMVDSGFTRGPMRELPYNQDTRHFGLAMEFIYTSDSDAEDGSY